MLIPNHPDSAFKLLQQLQKQYRADNNEHALAICEQQLGRILSTEGAYSQALVLYLKADKIFRRENDQLRVAENLNNIGQTYISARLEEKSLPLFKEALGIFKKLGNNQGIAKTYNLLGRLYATDTTYAISLDYQRQALQVYERLPDSAGMAKAYEDIGTVYEHTSQFSTALTYFNKALALNSALNNRLSRVAIINNIGDLYRKTGNLHKATATTLMAKKMAAALNDKRQVMSACDDLAKTYQSRGNMDSAFFYSDTSSIIYHQIFKDESRKQINLLETLFQLERKDSQISHLRYNQRLTLLLTGAALLICILIILLSFNIVSKQRLKNKNEKIIFQAQADIMEADLKNKMLEQAKLQEELEMKSKELTTHTLHIIQKNQLLEELKSKLHAVIKSEKRDQRREIRQLVDLIDTSKQQDKHWEDFRIIFERVHTDFFANLKEQSSDLTASDLRLLALLKMNLGAVDISTMIGISPNSLRTAKYRLRQKLQLPEGESLSSFVQKL